MPYFRFFLLFLLCSPLLAQTDLRPELIVSQGHIQMVNAVDFAPDNRYIATGSADRSIKIWDRALKQEYRTLYGHKTGVQWLRFTRDGKYLLSAVHGAQEIFVWDFLKGTLLRKIPIQSNTHPINLANDPKELIVQRAEGYELVDIETGQLVRTLHDLIDVGYIGSHPHKAEVVSYTHANELSFYDLRNQKLLRSVKVPFTMGNEVVFSPDGKKMAVASLSEGRLAVWDNESLKLLHDISLEEEANGGGVVDMAFDNKDKHLFVLLRNGDLLAYKLRNGKLVKRLQDLDDPTSAQGKSNLAGMRFGVATDLALSPDNTFLGAACTIFQTRKGLSGIRNFMGVRFWEVESLRAAGELTGYFKLISDLMIGPEERFLGSSNIDNNTGFRLWNLRDGDIDRFIPTTGISCQSGDKRRLAVWSFADSIAKLQVLEFPNLKSVLDIPKLQTLNGLALDEAGKRLALQTVKVDAQNPQNNQSQIQIIEVETGTLLQSIPLSYQEGLAEFNSLQLSPSGEEVLIIGQLGMGAWSVETGEKISNLSLQLGYDRFLDFEPETGHAVIAQAKPRYDMESKSLQQDIRFVTWDYRTGRQIQESPVIGNGVFRAGDFSQDGEYFVTGGSGYFGNIEFKLTIWDWSTLQPLCQLQGHTGGVSDVCFGPKGKRLYSASEDGTIRVWSIDSCRQQAAFIGMGTTDYILLDTNNYYKASRGSNKGIGFRYGKKLYTFDQFDLRFHRPDKVMSALGASPLVVRMYEKAYEKRLSSLGFNSDAFSGDLQLPALRIVNQQQLPLSTEKEQLELTLEHQSNGLPLSRLMVYINDVPYPNSKGIPIKNKEEQGSLQVEVPLNSGGNLVQVSVINERGLESARESININCLKERRPDLYLLTVGVSEYQDSLRNLRYAAKDARDLGNLMHENPLFGKIESVELLDGEARRDAVLQAARKLFAKAKVNDYVIVYLSSHGVLDDSLNYFLAMHDMNFARPAEGGLAYQDVEQLFDRSEARQRLLFIDACHSGEIDRSQRGLVEQLQTPAGDVAMRSKSGGGNYRAKAGLSNSFAYMKNLFSDISKGTGTTVISAAGGFEFALESEDWNNGVFTYAVLQALQNREADANSDAHISVLELKRYVVRRVLELTNGKQRPTTRSENVVNDFLLQRLTK